MEHKVSAKFSLGGMLWWIGLLACFLGAVVAVFPTRSQEEIRIRNEAAWCDNAAPVLKAKRARKQLFFPAPGVNSAEQYVSIVEAANDPSPLNPERLVDHDDDGLLEYEVPGGSAVYVFDPRCGVMIAAFDEDGARLVSHYLENRRSGWDSDYQLVALLCCLVCGMSYWLGARWYKQSRRHRTKT